MCPSDDKTSSDAWIQFNYPVNEAFNWQTFFVSYAFTYSIEILFIFLEDGTRRHNINTIRFLSRIFKD